VCKHRRKYVLDSADITEENTYCEHPVPSHRRKYVLNFADITEEKLYSTDLIAEGSLCLNRQVSKHIRKYALNQADLHRRKSTLVSGRKAYSYGFPSALPRQY
jgi:hypothetical protein